MFAPEPHPAADIPLVKLNRYGAHVALAPVPELSVPAAPNDSVERLAGVYRELGSRLRTQGRASEAISAYRQVLTLHPDNAEIGITLAECVKEQGQFEEAALLYKHALSLAPAGADT